MRVIRTSMKIVSKGFVEGYYYRPRVDMEVLEQYHSGIIALSASWGRGAALSCARTL